MFAFADLRRSLTAKVLLGLLALGLVFVAVYASARLLSIRNSVIERESARALLLAEPMHFALENLAENNPEITTQTDRLQRLVEYMSRTKGLTSLAVMDASGRRALAASGNPALLLGAGDDLPQRAQSIGTPLVETSADGQSLLVAVPLRRPSSYSTPSQAFGALVVQYDLAGPIAERQRQTLRDCGVLAVAMLAMVLVALVGLRVSILAPVARLARQAAALGSGRLSARSGVVAPPGGGDEISRLAAGFDQMGAGLEAAAAAQARLHEELRASEARGRAVFEHASLAISQGDREGRILDANPAFLKLWGYTLEELRDVRWIDLTHPDDRPESLRESKRLLAGEIDGFALEKRYVRKDGQIAWASVNVASMRDENAEVQMLVLVAEDITGRKAAEQAKAEREELFQAMFEDNRAIQLLIDPESGTIIDANHAASDFYGYRREDLRGRHIRDINTLPPEELRAILAEARSRGGLFHFAHRLRSGELRQVEVRSGSFKAGGRTLILSSIQDITLRLRTEEALKETEERLRELINLMDEGVALTTAEGRLTFVNPAFARMVGKEPEALEGLPYTSLLAPETAATQPERHEARRKGSREPYEAHYLRDDGSRALARVMPFPLFSREGRYQGSCAIVTDITQARAREEADQLRQLRRSALLRLNEMHNVGRQDLLDFALEQVQALTASPFGYIYAYDDTRRQFTLHSWSAGIMEQCKVQRKQTIYNLDATGIWGDAVRLREPVLVNDFTAPDPRRKGLPEGHVPLARFLTLPVIRAGRVVAVIGVGNKQAPYDDEDVTQLKIFTDGLWSVLERQEAVAQLSTVNERFHLAVRAGRIGLWDWDLTSGAMHCDAYMEKSFGLTGCDLTGTPEDWLCRIHSEDRPRVREALEIARATGERFEQSFRVPGPGGAVLHMDSLALTYLGSEDEPLRMVGVNIDVTRQRQAEEQVAESQRFLQSVIDTLPTPFVCKDADGRYLLANTAFTQLFDLSSEQVLGRTMHDFAPHERADMHRAKDELLLADPSLSPLAYEVSTAGPGQAGRHWLVVKSHLPLSGGRKPGLAAITLDITGRKLAEEALGRAKTAAEAATLAKAQFLANMSHEIRTPLSGVIGAAKMLSQSKLSNDQRQLADMAVESGRALLAIVNDILDFSKIEAGRLDIKPAPFALRADLESVAAPFRLLAEQRSLTLELVVDLNVPDALVGDSGRLDQVLRNLLGNAVKFTEKGAITLEVCTAPGCPTPRSAACVRFTVRDTGVGISPDFLPHLFESFSQADETYGKRHGGTGLGLAISRSLVERMGGSLGVESTLGAGSAFSFTLCLPLAAQSQLKPDAEAASPASPAVQRDESLHVLLADDNEIGRTLLTRILKDAGHTTVSVADGFAVFTALGREHFDLVLMDVQMPEMDGPKATQMIRQGLAGAHNTGIPIVALTAYAQAEDRERFLAAGMDDYVPKPVEEDELFAAMRRAMHLRPERRQARSAHAAQAEGASSDPALSPRFDLGFLERSFGDRSDLLAEMLTQFQTLSLPEIEGNLRQALTAKNMHKAERVAHKARGSFGTVGARRAVLLAQAAEKAAAAGDGQALKKFAKALLKEIAALDEHLRQGRPWPDTRSEKDPA
jgi:PAS domain S-box-containing protein